MALAWKAGWVNSPRGFESRILRVQVGARRVCSWGPSLYAEFMLRIREEGGRQPTDGSRILRHQQGPRSEHLRTGPLLLAGHAVRP